MLMRFQRMFTNPLDDFILFLKKRKGGKEREIAEIHIPVFLQFYIHLLTTNYCIPHNFH